MKKYTRSLSVVMAITLSTAIVLSGCGAGNSKKAVDTNVNTKTTEAKKMINIVAVVPNNADNPLFPEVLEKVNKILEAKANVKLDVQLKLQPEYTKLIPLMMASGEYFDFVFMAPWANYAAEAAKGGFKELNKEIIQKNMPLYVKDAGPGAYTDAMINGKLFMLPRPVTQVNPGVIVARKDLREKYGLPPIKNNADLETYFAAVKKNNPEVIPYNLGKNDIPNIISQFNKTKDDDYHPINGTNFSNGSFPGMLYRYSDAGAKLGTIYDNQVNKEFDLSTAKIIKRFYDAGYINKNPMSNGVLGSNLILEGKSAIAQTELSKVLDMTQKLKAKNMDLEIIYTLTYTQSLGGKYVSKVLNAGYCLNQNCKEPDRVLQALDLIINDPEIVNAFEFGIEGKSYSLSKDGRIEVPAGIDPTKSPYKWDSVGFFAFNENVKKALANQSEEEIKILETSRKNAFSPVLDTFQLDTTNIKTEVAALKDVDDTYEVSLRYGMVEDVEKGYAALEKKRKEAGYDKVLAEVKRQTDEFLKIKKLK